MRIEKTGEIVCFAGGRVSRIIMDAVITVNSLDKIIHIHDMFPGGIFAVLNGVRVNFAPDSNPELLYRDFMRAMGGYIDGPIGPYPNQLLSAEELASDDRKRIENERKEAERADKWRKKQEEKKQNLLERLSHCPPMAFKDENAWEESRSVNGDSYGGYILRYAENWARLMQKAIADGGTIACCAESLSDIADTEGLSGFQYGCAVALLAKCWEHGEELRYWHNKNTQIGTEGDRANENGGVLNPALMTIG